MISNFSILNETTGDSYTFGQNISCDYLYKSDGLDWGSVTANHNTYNYPNQVGVSISSTKLNSRDIFIQGYVFYILSDEEKIGLNYKQMAEYAYGKIKEKKVMLNELVNPSDYLKIIIGDYFIEGKPSSSIVYGNTEEDNNMYFCKFLISIFCANPMFKKNTIVETVIQGSEPAFHFPFSIPQNEGIIFGTRFNYLLLSVENEGGVSVGGRIILEAKGDIENPTLEKLLTGEKIKINKTLRYGEKIIIDTTDGKNRGVIGGFNEVYTNYLRYWDFSNTWFKFDVGTTLVGYSTDDSSENLLDVVIELNPEKYALEEM